MKIVVKILLYTVAVFVVGCLLAPPFYWLGRWAVDADLLPQIEGFGFQKYFNRAILVIALISVWPFLRWIGVRRWTDLGLEPNPHRFKDLAWGIGVGLVGLWIVALLSILTDAAWLRTSEWHKLLAILATAVTVPILEEALFRGALFGLLRRNLSWPTALGFLSFFFAVIHFLKKPHGAPRITDVHWYSGFEHLPRIFWQFGEPQLVIGGWVSLFLVGWILGYTVVRTRSLYWAMGLHGGWIFALQSFSRFSDRRGTSIWFGNDIKTGLAPVLLLLCTLAVVHFLLRQREGS